MAERITFRSGNEFPTMEQLKDNLKNMELRMDDWQNLATGLGNATKDARLQATYQFRSYRSYVELENMYEQNAMAARICDAKPKHATREWIKPVAQDDDDWGEELLDAFEDLSAKTAFREAGSWANVYGGAGIVIGANDGQDPSQPLNLESVQDVRFLNVVSRRYLTPASFDKRQGSPHYGRPEHYWLSVGNPVRVHRSRLLIFQGVESERTRINSEGWGRPYLERVWEPLRAYGTAHGYAEALLKDLNQATAKIKGLAAMMVNKKAKELTKDRLELMAYAASVLNMILLDEGEEYERKTLTLTGIADILEAISDRLAAETGMPITVLFGKAPAGMSTDDASGMRNWYDEVRTYQEDDLLPKLNHLAQVVSAAKSGTVKRLPEKWKISFNPLEEESPKEKAETESMNASTDTKLVQFGIITPEEARSRHKNNPESPYSLDDSFNADIGLEDLDDGSTQAPGVQQGESETGDPDAESGGEDQPPRDQE